MFDKELERYRYSYRPEAKAKLAEKKDEELKDVKVKVEHVQVEEVQMEEVKHDNIQKQFKAESGEGLFFL